MARFFEIPLTPEPQKFGISLAGRALRLRVYWCDTPEGGWVLDINEDEADGDASIIAGLPLVTGADLLRGFEYLGLGGGLIVDSELPPTLSNLGQDARLLFVVEDGEK